MYYPNFLFEFPDKIYINSATDDEPKQKFYYRFIQDVLDSIDTSLSIDQSLLERFNNSEGNNPRALQSTVNRMSSALDGLMHSLNMFNFSNGNRKVIVNSPTIDANNKVYIRVQIQEGDDSYDIKERSLGFRWFFTFALLTQFRIKRAGKRLPLFIFDEPASNLHQTNQQKLLTSLENLVDKSESTVIYATHSHHLINPKRLESTYIVRNQALGLNDEGNYLSSMTDIKIYKYRDFVSKYPTEKDYFQPILDVLEYAPSKLESLRNAVIFEGKNDFYTISWYMGTKNLKFDMIPGLSATKLSTLISLYYGWARKFIIILDSDKAGVNQKKRYEEDFGVIIKDRVFTLADIDELWKNLSLEHLLTEEERLSIQHTAFPDDITFSKKHFNISIQELMNTKQSVAISLETQNKFTKILEFMNDKIFKQ